MSSEACLHAAEILLAARELDAAIIEFNRAETAGADAAECSAGRWLAYMLQGNFEAAWVQSDRIHVLHLPDPHGFWDGEPLDGKQIIVRCLHGFGDTVQLFQYAPLLAELAAQVWWEVPPEMLPIAQCFKGVDNVITWGELAPPEPPPWEVQLEVTELPYIFRTQPRDLPLQRCYLHLSQDYLDLVSGAMGPRRLPRVGVVWTAGAWNTSRSIPAEQFAALLYLEGVEWWNLQGGSSRYELPDCPAARLNEIAACRDGILPLAAVIAQLDLLVTVDTLAVHLAGALGVPTLLLLQHAADWRWMHGRSDTPWYPSVRLIRQPAAGNWLPVLNQTLELVPAMTGEAPRSHDSSEITCSS